MHLLLNEKRDTIPFVPKPMGLLAQFANERFKKNENIERNEE